MRAIRQDVAARRDRRAASCAARLTGAVALALCALALLAATAFAEGAPLTYEQSLSEQLNEAAPGGAFGEPQDLTFDAAGNLYLSDVTGNNGQGIIDKFNSAEAFQVQLGGGVLTGQYTDHVAVDDATGDIYVADSNFGEVFVLGPHGEQLSPPWKGANTPEKTFGGGCCFVDVAVDNSAGLSKGDVYVMTASNGGEVDVFEPQNGDKEEGKFLRRLQVPGGFKLGEAGSKLGIAVDNSSGATAGDVYVSDFGNQAVDRFSPGGTFEAAHQIVFEGEQHQPEAVAVSPLTGDVFVVRLNGSGSSKGTLLQYNSSGLLLTGIAETAPEEALADPLGVAVEPAGPNAGDVYLVEGSKRGFAVYEPGQPAAPTVIEASVVNVSAEAATFDGEIDQNGLETHYYFEYGACAAISACPTSAYEHSVPVPNARVGASGDYKVKEVGPFRVEDLSPDTVYHYRIVADNSQGETRGEERTFTGQPTGEEFALPDGRQWELVSPAEKLGASLGGVSEVGVIEAAANGNAISYTSNSPTESEPPGWVSGVQVLSTRGSNGAWSTRDIESPHEAPVGVGEASTPEYQVFSEDLSKAIVQPYGPLTPKLAVEASETTAFLHELGPCAPNTCWHPLVTGKPGYANVPSGTAFGEEELCEEASGAQGTVESQCGPRYVGANTNLGAVVLRSKVPLAAGAYENDLYEWASGSLALVSVLPPNEKGEELPIDPSSENLEAVPTLGSDTQLSRGKNQRAISADGSRVVWQASRSGAGAPLYMRDMRRHQTFEIDTAETACAEEGHCESGGGRFQIASVDGSRVIFTDEHALTKDAASGNEELYECRVVEAAGRLGCELVDLTPPSPHQVSGIVGDILGASEDASTVYFVADGVLAPGASDGDCTPTFSSLARRCNLYVRRGGTTSYVGMLSGVDAALWEGTLVYQQSGVSADGNWLAFASLARPTGYDNRDAASGQPDAEIYLYDAGSGRLVCASCNPSGARPTGVEYGPLTAESNPPLSTNRGEFGTTSWVSGLLPHDVQSLREAPDRPQRFIFDNGRLFFDSIDALSPQDVNGTSDVYEYEPPGAGECSEASATFAPRAAGCIDLISSGTSPEPSTFLDASATGGDVFFNTSAKLVPEDVDAAVDVYDARECTAVSPCQPPGGTQPPACITEASCKAAPSPQPAIFGAPASATFSGPGNFTTMPAGFSAPKPKTAAQIRAERLAKALKACRRNRARGRRWACERKVRRRYGAKPKVKGARAPHTPSHNTNRRAG